MLAVVVLSMLTCTADVAHLLVRWRDGTKYADCPNSWPNALQTLNWGERLPALSAGVTQLSNSFTNLTQRISLVWASILC